MSDVTETSSDEYILDVELVDCLSVANHFRDVWESLRRTNSVFLSPYFDLEFTLAVNRIREDILIAVVFRDGVSDPIGFWPLQLSDRKHAYSVGHRINDLHGVLGPDFLNTRMLEILRKLGVKSYKFHSNISSRLVGSSYVFAHNKSYFVDLGIGLDTYLEWARRNSKRIRRQPQKTRALLRQFPNSKFKFDCKNKDLFQQLIDLKRRKFQRTDTFDILSVDWIQDSLLEIYNTDQNGFKGLFSAIYNNEDLVAGHFGMISGNQLHYWFPAYNPRYEKYSPGYELFLSVVERAADLGVTKIDFGFGSSDFKTTLCNREESTLGGMVSSSLLRHQFEKRRYLFRQWSKTIPFQPALKKIFRKKFPQFGAWNFD